MTVKKASPKPAPEDSPDPVIPDPAPDPIDPETPQGDDGDQEEPDTVEVDGHTYTLVEGARDDFELLDDLSQMSQSGDSVYAPSILRRLLGPEQARAALNRLRDEKTGRVSIDAGTAFVLKLLDDLNPN